MCREVKLLRLPSSSIIRGEGGNKEWVGVKGLGLGLGLG
jgi:hypothetical protein